MKEDSNAASRLLITRAFCINFLPVLPFQGQPPRDWDSILAISMVSSKAEDWTRPMAESRDARSTEREGEDEVIARTFDA